jgi:hypothetical protein
MKNYVITILLMFTLTKSNAQLKYLAPNQNFYTWANSAEHYLDSMRLLTNNDTLFYLEGGEYAAYKRYFEINRNNASVTGNVLLHSQQLHDYYQAHPLISGASNRATSANNDTWQELGPNKPSILNSNALSLLVSYQVPISATLSNSGPTQQIAIYEANSQHMLVSSLDAGLFNSTDGGTTWLQCGER